MVHWDAINIQLDTFKRDFIEPSFNHANITFSSVACLYSLNISYHIVHIHYELTKWDEGRGGSDWLDSG